MATSLSWHPPMPEGHAQEEQMPMTDTLIGNIRDTLS